MPSDLKETQSLNREPYDLIIIGGGINGTGVARDAALRGMRVLLLEKNDFGAGTSAYSSRLIHGGVRYLAHLELDLVAESLQERERLLHNAPHLVRPLAMAIPLYPGSKNPPFLVQLGMLIYDWLSLGKSIPKHRMLNREEFLTQYPGLRSKNLLGGPVYFDAQADFPERICVENALAAKETGLATLLNHTSVTSIRLADDTLPQVQFQNMLTGETQTVTGKVLINAAGPWVDDVLDHTKAQTQQPFHKRLIGGTKGSHIVVHQFEDGPKTALYVEAQSDGRPFFIIPWRKQYYLIGTTDLHFEGRPDQAVATADEVNYLLAETNYILPTAKLAPGDVLYTYSGIRPLPYSAKGTTGKVTRKHWVYDHASEGFPRVVSLVGGKLTTYRNLSEQAVDQVIRAYKLTQPDGQPWPKCSTRNLPLPGGKGIGNVEMYAEQYVRSASRKQDVPPETVAYLIGFYGSRYEAVLALCKDARLKQPLAENVSDIGAQVIYAVRNEMAQTVMDVMLRRLGCGLNGDAGLRTVDVVANLMSEELHWSDEKRQAEVEGYRAFIARTALAFKRTSVHAGA